MNDVTNYIMEKENKNYSDVSELVELPDSESGRYGGSSPSVRAKPGPKPRGNWLCKCCNKTFKSRGLLYEHKRSLSCSISLKREGHRKVSEKLKGRAPWNKGKKLSEEHKEKIRKAAKNRNSYWFYNSKNPIIYTRKYDNKEIKLDSKWELEVVKRLDSLNIKWYRPKITFEYSDSQGESHSYHPDFFIPEYKCFLEVKSPYVEQLQNINGKIDFLKRNYNFIIWLESLDACKTFNLQKCQYDIVPLEEEENEALIEDIKSKSIKVDKRKENSLKLAEERRKILNEAINNKAIDFSKFGWVDKVSKLFGIAPNKVNIYLKNNLPDLYGMFYHRKSPTI